MEIETKQVRVEEKESIWELIRFALMILVIAVGVRVYIAQPFVVSGSSMVPTFQDKNYLIIDEISYRFKDPNRGDVVIFHPPGQPKGIYYIKRIIGLPGDTVTIKNDTVSISNAAHPEGFTLTEPYVSAPTTTIITKTVGQNEYFVMGDNRPFSSDSRYWGLLPRENIVGRALVRLFPLKEIGILPGAYESYAD